jgi:hypothetical protein
MPRIFNVDWRMGVTLRRVGIIAIVGPALSPARAALNGGATTVVNLLLPI